MNSDAPLPSWLTALLEQAGPDTLILKAGDPPYVVRSGSACHLSTVPLTRVSMEALARDVLSADGWKVLSSTGSFRLVLRGPDIPVEVRADRLDDQLVVRLHRLGEAEHATSTADATADLVAALGAAARTPEVEAAIDALRQRLPTSTRATRDAEKGAARDPEKREATTAATVVELHRRREIATDRFSVDDWVAEAVARGARTLYLPAGSVPFVRIDGHVAAFSSDVLPLAMFEQAAAAMTAERDGWYQTRGELEWSKHFPEVGTIRCEAFSDVRGGGLVVHLPVSQPFGLEQVIPAHVRTACEAGDGMVVISAPFAEDVAAMVEAVVAWQAKRRPGYFIAFGRGSGLERLAGRAFVSERLLPDTHQAMAAAISPALRERPDVLVVAGDSSDLPGCEAIVSAAVGRLAIVGVVARTAPRALEVILKDLLHPEARNAFAAVFTSGCSWRRVRRPGRKAIVLSDTLIRTEHVTALIREGDIAGLDRLQRDEKDGMRTVDAALASAVARKKITLREAAACAVDRKALIGLVLRKTRQERAALRAGAYSTERASTRRPATGA
jgi:Tfp pilus assembly pilus retraction ATPase PilT